HETVTGCVATAMAQVMKYHNFPEHGTGKHSYFWRPGEEELSFDYDATPFKWDLMDDRYDKDSSDESRDAVAELMLGCGISVDMHYEPGGSGAATSAMGESLINIFGYSKSLWMPNRAFYGYDEWEDMIYDDLAKGLPVLYSGAGTAGGHQFVCDGYSSDGFFHFNWGWGGLSNGYFLLTALNPDNLGVGGGAGGFNSSQVATLGVCPSTGTEKPVYLFYNTESFIPVIKTVSAGDDFRCTGQYFNYGLSTMPDGSCLGMKFVSYENGDVKYVEGPEVGGFHPNDGRNDLQVRFPELPDGKYHITPVLHADGEWTAVRMPVGAPNMVVAIVKDGVASFEDAAPASIRVVDAKLPKDIFVDHDFPMSFVVENTGDSEFYSTVTPMLLNDKGEVVSKSVFRPVDVLEGEKENISDYIGCFSAEKGESLPTGSYSLVFRDEAGRNVSDPIVVDMKVNEDKAEIRIEDFKIDSAEPITNPSSVDVVMNVSCESGVYFGSAKFVVFPGDGGYEVYSKSSERVYLSPGESREVTITADMSKLVDGRYMAVIYYEDEMMTDRVYFQIQKGTDAVNCIDGESSGSVIYDLNGVRHLSSKSAGIYVINGKKVLLKP
ncbi:MAG: C10 family peptidase, partial [Muribaculaceae bacterium]|nr:C10 family peptidase [Muribaculaceae bacterium]